MPTPYPAPDDAMARAFLLGGAPRQLWKRYTLAVGLVLSLLAATLVVKEYEIHLGLKAAETINLAGQQRMLSQRILFLTREPLPITAADWQELATLLQMMADAHHVLTTDPALPAAVYAIYFGTDTGESLDSMTRDFVQAGRALVDAGDSSARREELRDIGRDRLLNQLERAVTTIQREFFRSRTDLQHIAYATLAAAFVTVMFEVLVIFWPAQKFSRTTLHQLQVQRARIQADAIRLEVELRTSEQLRKEQREFTYALSHELKSPGNTLAMLLEELQAIPAVENLPEAADLVRMSRDTVHRMARLIESVLAYTQTIDGDMTCAPVDLDALIVAVKADLAGSLRDSRAEMTVQPLGTLTGNAAQLWVLLQNLIGNAIKFRSPDRPLRIDFHADRDAARGVTTIRVTDNGIGIPPEHRQRVFGLFKRLHTNGDYPGSGMGLTLCAHVAAKHGGTITIEDGPAPGVGCTVVVRLHDAVWSLPKRPTGAVLPPEAQRIDTAA